MALTKFSIFLLTVIMYLLMMIFVRRNRDHHEKVEIFSIGHAEFEASQNTNNYVNFGILHIEQVIKKAEESGNLTVVNYVNSVDRLKVTKQKCSAGGSGFSQEREL